MAITDIIDKALAVLKVLTWKRVAMASVVGLIGLVGYTLFENRQQAYEVVTSISGIKGDLVMSPPSKAGVVILRSILKSHPEIAAIAIVDADPLSNTRLPLHFEFNDTQVEVLMKEVLSSGIEMKSPLFTNNPANNKQVLAVLSGEFMCAPANEGNFARLFEKAVPLLSYTCRVPLPPAYGQATGWISLHVKGKLPAEIDHLKFDALNMAVAYYNSEIAVRNVKVVP